VIDVPDWVRNRARAHGYTAWLDQLPALVAAVERSLAIRVGRTYAGGTEAFVADAERSDGSFAVVKIYPNPQQAREEGLVLELCGGEGCAQLLDSDPACGALLIERLGPSLNDLGVPYAERLPILCATAAKVWRPAPDCGLMNGIAKGRSLIEMIVSTWEELDRPCTRRAVDYAIECAERRIRAHDDERAVLVHGDVHEWNTLRAGDGFKLVDPDGLLIEAEYELGVLVREDPLELMRGDPRTRARWLAARTGLDAEAIWEWGAVERVSTGLVATKIDLQPVGRQMLEVADQVARVDV